MCALRSVQIQLAKRQRANKAGLPRHRPPRARARAGDSGRMGVVETRGELSEAS